MVSGTIGSNGGNTRRRAILKFNLAGQIPTNATVTSATLRLNVVFKLPSGAANSTFDVRRVLQPWSESAVTWNDRLSGVPWSSPGASSAPDSSSAASASKSVSGFGAYVFGPTASLTADVQAWVSNPASNQGWLVLTESEGTSKTARHFGTREDSANAATLVIDYTVPVAAVPPSITAQPQNQTVLAGGSAVFFVTAAGTGPLSYQWQRNGTNLPGATNTTFTVATAQASDQGNYVVTVSNAGGSTNSVPAVLTVATAPAIETIERVGNLVQFVFTVQTQLPHTVEYTSVLPPDRWLVLTNLTIASPPQKVTVPDAISTNAQRFYRLRVNAQ